MAEAILRVYRAGLVPHGAIAARGVNPILLNQEIQAAKLHVCDRAAARTVSRAKMPGAFVGVLISALIVPGVEIRIRRGFLEFVRDHRSHSISPGVSVRAGSGLPLA